jgi:AAA15 family ATPase/GTPase
MLIEFSVENYRSFKDHATLSMVASKITAKDKQLDEENVIRIDDQLALLKSAAIYGANASGKSNLVDAIRFMRGFVLTSSKGTQIAELINVEPFRLSTETENKPSYFEIVFLLDRKQYRYGFEVNAKRVVAEWLYYVPKSREAKLFERHLDKITFSNTFKEGKGIADKTRENALFISVSAQFNGPIAKNVVQWFKDLNISSGLDDVMDRLRTLERFESERDKVDIVQFVKRLDLGIADIQTEKASRSSDDIPSDFPEELRELLTKIYSLAGEHTIIRTFHQKYDSGGRQASLEVFDIDRHESDGTKKLFALAYPLIQALRNGHVLVIDELDARLHPLVTRTIIELFNSKESNPGNAQLIFTTHDTNLLSNKFFRRDQIWFTEKDKLGATHLYSLVEYKVRNDASFESDYIHGKYGAIPFIGNVSRLIGEVHAG